MKRVRDIMPTLRAAMAAAQSGTPGRWFWVGQWLGPRVWALRRHSRLSVFPALTGPVFVELPIDVLYPYFMVQKQIVSTTQPKNIMGQIVFW